MIVYENFKDDGNRQVSPKHAFPNPHPEKKKAEKGRKSTNKQPCLHFMLLGGQFFLGTKNKISNSTTAISQKIGTLVKLVRKGSNIETYFTAFVISEKCFQLSFFSGFSAAELPREMEKNRVLILVYLGSKIPEGEFSVSLHVSVFILFKSYEIV